MIRFEYELDVLGETFKRLVQPEPTYCTTKAGIHLLKTMLHLTRQRVGYLHCEDFFERAISDLKRDNASGAVDCVNLALEGMRYGK